MTDISLFNRALQSEDRSWDLTPPDAALDQGGTLDITLFNAAQHYANGYIPSGTVLGKVTATSKWGPYLSTAGDGRQIAAAILRFSIQVTRYDGTLPANVGFDGLVHGKVDASKLPFTSGTAALGGYLDAAAQTALKLIYFGTN